MEIGNTQVVDSRENSTMVSTWNTYLCIERISDSEYKLCVRGYEILCEVYDYQKEIGKEDDEDFDIYENLPETYYGMEVRGVEDGEFIVGGDLVETGNEGDDEECIFNIENKEMIKSYLYKNWDMDIYREIEEILIKEK